MKQTFAELGFPGRLLAVEGLDGSGKSTQIHLLQRWLELQGLKVFFSEWNSSDLVKAATSKGKRRHLLSPTTFSLIHATDFADRYERQLIPLMRAGYLVLCDRYVFTAYARDTVRGCPEAWVRGTLRFCGVAGSDLLFERAVGGIGGADPGPATGAQVLRVGHGPAVVHRSAREFRMFQGRLLEQYLAMSTEFGFLVLDASLPVEAQQGVLRQLVATRIGLESFHVSKR
jgi:dTMP kinase